MRRLSQVNQCLRGLASASSAEVRDGGVALWRCELVLRANRQGWPDFYPCPWNNGELALNAFERAFARKLTPPRKFLSCAIVEVKGGVVESVKASRDGWVSASAETPAERHVPLIHLSTY